MKKIIAKHTISAYYYLEFITKAIRGSEPFEYSEINQLGARLSGKTTSDNLELVRAIIEARNTNQSLVIFICEGDIRIGAMPEEILLSHSKNIVYRLEYLKEWE